MRQPIEHLRRRAAAWIAAVLVALPAAARAQSSPPHTLVGDWRGTSICTPVGKPACHDEVVVYHFTALPDSAGLAAAGVQRLHWTANKIVAGQEESMGEMTCTYAPSTGDLTCPMRGWTWTLHARGVTLDGILANPSGVVWRNIHATRAE
jgi:hypothetical protein